MHFDFEAEHIGVKGDHRVDIVYDVPNTDLAHIFTSKMDSFSASVFLLAKLWQRREIHM